MPVENSKYGVGLLDLFGRLVEGGRLVIDVDAEGKPLLDIQPAKKSDKPKSEAATA